MFKFIVVGILFWSMTDLLAKTSITAKKLVSINHFSSLQPAYSKGSLGLKIGVGFEEHTWDGLPALNRQVYRSSIQGSGHIGFTRVSIHKGTPWPVDFGFTMSQAVGSDISQVGAYMKATLFEGFKLPSVAIQVSRHNLYGLGSSQVSGDQGAAIIDYSFLSYVTLFASYQVQLDKIKTDVDSQAQLSMDRTSGFEKDIRTESQNIGLIYRAWPGIVDITIQEQRFDFDTRYIIQASFGL